MYLLCKSPTDHVHTRMLVSIKTLFMIVCLPIPTGCLSTMCHAFYGLILPDGFSEPLLCVRNSIFITNPGSKMS